MYLLSYPKDLFFLRTLALATLLGGSTKSSMINLRLSQMVVILLNIDASLNILPVYECLFAVKIMIVRVVDSLVLVLLVLDLVNC